MPRELRKSLTNSSSKYIFARGISAALALMFSFYYSRAIGVENRSILTFAMATTLIMAIFFTSGTTLTFRKKFPREKSTEDISVVMGLLILESLLAAIGVLLAICIYSIFKINLPRTLIVVIFVYSFIATLCYASIETILAIGKFNVAAILEIITILLQISIYVTMRYFKVSSIAVAVFSSLIISYLVCQISCWMLLVSENPSPPPKYLKPYLSFLKSTRHNHSYAISNGFVDRIDKIIIGWFLPLGLLGKFAITTSLINYVRFIPDAITKLIISKTKNQKKFTTLRPSISAILLVILIVTSGVLLSQLLIKVYFGLEWVLPILIPSLFALQELARGFFQIECSRLMVSGNEIIVARQNLWMAVTAFLFCIFGVKIAGLYGVPVSLGLNYILHTLLLHKQERRSSS